jgi:predicted secreted Zn-dependent protease
MPQMLTAWWRALVMAAFWAILLQPSSLFRILVHFPLILPICNLIEPLACHIQALQNTHGGSLMLKRVFIASAVLCAAPTAYAAPKSITQYSYYKISGNSAASVMRSLNQNTISVGGDGAYATTEFQYSAKPKFQQLPHSCRIASAGQLLKFTIKLPKLASSAALVGSAARAWNNFASFVRRHEETHRQLYESCARRHEAELAALSAGSCDQVENLARQLWKKTYNACIAMNNDFDASERSRLSAQSLVIMAANSN